MKNFFALFSVFMIVGMFTLSCRQPGEGASADVVDEMDAAMKGVDSTIEKIVPRDTTARIDTTLKEEVPQRKP